MILSLNKKDVATMVLHMHIMKKSFRNLIKARFKGDKVKLIESYDFILESVRKALTGELELYELNLNIQDVEVLEGFLKAYTTNLRNTYTEVGLNKVNLMDIEQMEILEKLSARTSSLLGEAYAK